MGKGRYNWLITHDPKWIGYHEAAKKAMQYEEEIKKILNLYGIKNIDTRAKRFATHGNPCYMISKGAQIKKDEAILCNSCYIITGKIYPNMPDIIKEAPKAMQWLVNEINYAYKNFKRMNLDGQNTLYFVRKYYECFEKLEKEYEEQKNFHSGEGYNKNIEMYNTTMEYCVQLVNEYYKNECCK